MAKPEGLVLALYEDVLNNRCVPIVGAGMSENAASNPIPHYGRMAEALSSLLEPEDKVIIHHPDREPDKVFELLAERPGEQGLKERICEFVKAAKPGAPHETFSRIPWPFVLTTNYDFLIEDAYEKVGRSCTVVAAESDYANIRITGGIEGDTSIVKLHGDCNHYASMVVRPSSLEYERYRATHPLLGDFLLAQLGYMSAFFIGYSLRDPHIGFLRKVLEVLHQQSGGRRRNDYYLLIDPSSEEMEERKRDGLLCIPLHTEGDGQRLSRAEVLLRFLRDLHTFCARGGARAKVPEPPPDVRCRAVLPKREVGSRTTSYASVEEALPAVISALGETSHPVLAIWTANDLVSRWLTWTARIASTAHTSAIVLTYEDLASADGLSMQGAIRALKAVDVAAGVVDVTDRATAATAANSFKASFSAPLVLVTPDMKRVPIYFADAIAVYEYAPDGLHDLTDPTLILLGKFLVKLILRHSFRDCEDQVARGKFEAAVEKLGTTMEATLRHLIEEHSGENTSRPDETDVREMINLLARNAAKWSLDVDREGLHRCYTLRTDAIHGNVKPAKAEAEWMLRFLEGFMTVNLGPNLTSFSRGGGALRP